MPSKSNELMALLDRFQDLLDVFRSHYFHPDFGGSNSIKAVLPVLVPTMTYQNMEVGNGSESQVVFEKLYDPTISTEERAKIRKDLLDYCRQDTLA